MPKITLLGAGSTVFARNLFSDCLSYPELTDGTYVLYDIDRERLAISEKMARQVAQAWHVHPIWWKPSASIPMR